MRMTITPKSTGKPLEFYCPDNGGYIYLESDSRPGVLGQQICQGGQFFGETLQAHSANTFKARCWLWYRAYRRLCAEYEPYDMTDVTF